MAITFQQVTEFNTADFEYLFSQSLPFFKPGGNFEFPVGIETDIEKKDFLAKLISDFMSSAAGAFSYAAYDDDLITSLVIGQMSPIAPGTLNAIWLLAGPNKAGTRNWMYESDTVKARHEFLADHGIDQFTITATDTSKILTNMEGSPGFELVGDKVVETKVIPDVELTNPTMVKITVKVLPV